jgi:hypothetical protein
MALLDQFLSGFSVQNEFAPQDQQEALLANLFRQIQASQAAPAQQPTPPAPAAGIGAPQIGEAQALPVGVQVPRGPDPRHVTDWQTTAAPEPAPPAGGSASVGLPAADYQPPRDLPVREEPKIAGAPYGPAQSAPMPMSFGHILPGPEPARAPVASAQKAGGRTWQQTLSDFGDALQGKDVPDREMQNKTAEAIATRFPELAGLAPAIVRDPHSLRAILPSLFGTRGENELSEVYDKDGRPQRALVNKRTGAYTPIGAPGIAKQDPVEMLARREDYKEQADLRKADGKRIAELNEQADAARGQLDNVRNLRIARDGVSYEGGYLSGPRTWLGKNLPDVLPGNGLPLIPSQEEAGRAESVESLAENVRLGFVEKTKGAVSDSEMRIFGAATPGMQMTDAGAQTIMDGMQAAADRTVERAKFYEAYRGQNKTLSGAQEAWDSYVAKNPIITADGKGGFAVNKGNVGNWRAYVGGEPQAAQTGGQGQGQAGPAALDEARNAIARGAPRDKVIERLRASGIDATGL